MTSFQNIAASALCAGLLAVSGTSVEARAPYVAPTVAAAPASDTANAEEAALKAHVAYLADDRLTGREPGTEGYALAADYVAREFKRAGLKPGADGKWFQQVPLVMTARELAGAEMEIITPGARRQLAYLQDFVASKPLDRETIAVEGDLVFAGYGVVDPVSGYDDYGAIDVKGKIVAVFEGAPKSFDGATRAYLGSSEVKRRNAAAKGAIGIVTLPTRQSEATTPWERTVEGAGNPAATFIDLNGAAHVPAPEIKGVAKVSAAGARALFAGSETNFDELQAMEADAFAGNGAQPRTPRFPHALPLPRIRLGGSTHITRIESPNVVGLVKGSDPKLRKEVVVISAHLDHIGVRKNAKPGEDAIRNGAMDNAVGVSMLIETAKRMAKSPPRRSVVFVAFTGEEKGLLGSRYFAKNPPLGDLEIIGNVNLDMPLTLFPLGDVIGFGAEHSSLGPLIEKTAAGMGLSLTPDPYPEEGIFTRSDHFNFVVEQGVPAVFLFSGVKNGGEAIFRDFMKKHYHRASDDMSLPIDWTSTATFADLNTRLANLIANDDGVPTWNEGDYFGERFGKKKKKKE